VGYEHAAKGIKYR